MCYATWEPASSLPRSLVADFEAGITAEPTIETTSMYGHVSSTMTVSQIRTDQPQTKKRKEERPCHHDLEGYLPYITLSVRDMLIFLCNVLQGL